MDSNGNEKKTTDLFACLFVYKAAAGKTCLSESRFIILDIVLANFTTCTFVMEREWKRRV